MIFLLTYSVENSISPYQDIQICKYMLNLHLIANCKEAGTGVKKKSLGKFWNIPKTLFTFLMVLF